MTMMLFTFEAEDRTWYVSKFMKTFKDECFHQVDIEAIINKMV